MRFTNYIPGFSTTTFPLVFAATFPVLRPLHSRIWEAGILWSSVCGDAHKIPGWPFRQSKSESDSALWPCGLQIKIIKIAVDSPDSKCRCVPSGAKVYSWSCKSFYPLSSLDFYWKHYLFCSTTSKITEKWRNKRIQDRATMPDRPSWFWKQCR